MKLFFSIFMSCAFFLSQSVFADPILKGSPASLEKQNHEADKSKLSRIENEAELELLIQKGLLIKIPETPGIKIDSRLNEQFHYVRPWTARFLTALGKKFQERFGSSLQINSATRTIVHQLNIAERNKNAAPTTGNTRSSHLTGASVDLAKKPLSQTQKKWLRAELRELEQKDVIEATEEHYQAVFHIMVFERYAPTEVRVALK